MVVRNKKISIGLIIKILLVLCLITLLSGCEKTISSTEDTVTSTVDSSNKIFEGIFEEQKTEAPEINPE